MRVKAGFELATFRLRKGIQQEIAASERGCRRATYVAYRGNLDTTDTAHTDARSAKKDVISTKPQKAMGAERTFPESKKKWKKKHNQTSLRSDPR